MRTVSAALRSGNKAKEASPTVDEDLREINKRLHAELSELRLKLIEMEMMADMDPLVPVLNRRAFMREINRAISVQNRYQIASTIIYFDLDNFKIINDIFGHQMGDSILRSVADIAQKSVRDCDVVARLGGDEFAILLFQSDAQLARVKAKNICEKIESASQILVTTAPSKLIDITKLNFDPKVSASWGVSQCLSNKDAEANLSLADQAMYEHKLQNRSND